MIAKHIAMRSAQRTSAVRLVRYLVDAQGKEVRTGAVRITNCHGGSLDAAVLEILNTQLMNTRSCADKTYHLVISFPRGERPDAAALAAVEERLCDGLGFAGHQRISVVHDDTDNLHVHVAINKIHPVRLTIHEPYRAYPALARLCEGLEDELGLQKDNHVSRQAGAASRATDMEHHAGVDSLLGFVRRECKERILAARSWDELHAVLADRGLRIHARANGLVITAADGTTVKASSIDRACSKPRLEQRLGPFQDAPDETTLRKPARRYERRPRGGGVDSAALYGRYRAAQALAADERGHGRDQARARKERRIEAAIRGARLKRAALKLAPMPGPVKKLLYRACTRAFSEEIAAVKHAFRRERQAVNRQHDRLQWLDWLRSAAQAGNGQALAVLRARQAHGDAAGAALAGGLQSTSPVRPRDHDSVTREGTVIYRAGGGAIRDDGARLSVSRGADAATVQCALRMAIARYGGRIVIHGPSSFQEQVIVAAVAGQVALTFVDPVLEQRRLALVAARAPAVCGLPNLQAAAARPVGLARRGAGNGTGGAAGRSGGQAGLSAPMVARAADRYVSEREQKRANGFDIPKHARYTDFHAGAAIYAGLRRVDGQALVLLKRDGTVLVREIGEAQVRRLRRLPLGVAVSVNAGGIVKAKGRGR